MCLLNFSVSAPVRQKSIIHKTAEFCSKIQRKIPKTCLDSIPSSSRWRISEKVQRWKPALSISPDAIFVKQRCFQIRKCLLAHSVNFGLNAHSVCANFDFNAYSLCHSIIFAPFCLPLTLNSQIRIRLLTAYLLSNENIFDSWGKLWNLAGEIFLTNDKPVVFWPPHHAVFSCLPGGQGGISSCTEESYRPHLPLHIS